MSNKWPRQRPVQPSGAGRPMRFRPEVQRYVGMLAATGMEEREVFRAGLYAQWYGMRALEGPDNKCVVFAEPSCKDWNCLKPDHQRLEYQENDL